MPSDDAVEPAVAGPDPARKAVTIYDVARLAGVAPSTVSRAFARPGRVRAGTADRVRAAAAELGYRANPLARALTTSRTQMLALMIPDVTNPFHAELVRGAQIRASEAGYTVVLADARESHVREREALERVLPVVEGIVIASSRMSDSTVRVIARQKPIIVLNRHVVGIPSVVSDNVLGMRRAAEHLARLGHAHVTYVAGPEASWADGTRWRALREAAPELSLHVRHSGPVNPTVHGGRSAASSMLTHPPTAVIAFNDLVGIGLVLAFAGAGIRVPQDVSVIGFDNIMAATLVSPRLTTVAAPVRGMGMTAVTDLLAAVHGARPRTDEPLTVPTRLVVRGSTAPPRTQVRTAPA